MNTRLMRRRKAVFFTICSAVLLLILVLLLRAWFQTAEEEAEHAVRDFYQYEQEGDYANSWQLFHSAMKEKFTKAGYIQDRAHVFMNHFGVETFEFEIHDADRLKSWTMTETSLPLYSVYKFEVIQTYRGKYGYFEIHQDVYAAKEDGEWRLLWDYHKSFK